MLEQGRRPPEKGKREEAAFDAAVAAAAAAAAAVAAVARAMSRMAASSTLPVCVHRVWGGVKGESRLVRGRVLLLHPSRVWRRIGTMDMEV